MSDEPILRLLEPSGALSPEAAGRVSAASGLDLPAAYRDMVLARRVDTEAVALQRQGELGLWPSMLGQEAAQIGAAHALSAHDMVFPTYREHGVAWCRGVDPIDLLGLFRGTTLGGWRPQDRNFGLHMVGPKPGESDGRAPPPAAGWPSTTPSSTPRSARTRGRPRSTSRPCSPPSPGCVRRTTRSGG